MGSACDTHSLHVIDGRFSSVCLSYIPPLAPAPQHPTIRKGDHRAAPSPTFPSASLWKALRLELRRGAPLLFARQSAILTTCPPAFLFSGVRLQRSLDCPVGIRSDKGVGCPAPKMQKRNECSHFLPPTSSKAGSPLALTHTRTHTLSLPACHEKREKERKKKRDGTRL